MSSFSFIVDFYDEVKEVVEENIKQENVIKCEFCNLKIEEFEFAGHNCFTIDQTIIQEGKIELDFDGDFNASHSPLNPTITEVEEEFKCEKCELKFKLENTLRQHLSSEHPKMKLLNCVKCDFKEGIKWFHCEKCDYECKMKRDLKSHNIYKHQNSYEIDWFKREQCDFKCNLTDDLNRHPITKHGISWFKCEKCDFKCQAKGDLNIHLILKHLNPEEIMYECQKCDYKCRTWANLKSHTTCKHSNRRPQQRNLDTN